MVIDRVDEPDPGAGLWHKSSGIPLTKADSGCEHSFCPSSAKAAVNNLIILGQLPLKI